jgi:hypothetical protein
MGRVSSVEMKTPLGLREIYMSYLVEVCPAAPCVPAAGQNFDIILYTNPA